MHCSDCSHENAPKAKFCSECGGAMALRCTSCDAVQPSDSKFCNQCGTRFIVGAAAERPVSESTAVRKNVTALFGDLVGSTSFGEQVDAETARTVMADYFELVRSAIENHAGTVVKFMGDGVMAVFGIPEVAEDDAVRAVTAGLELQQRFRAFADDVRRQRGVELGLRIGVNTGELVIGDDDADMVGDVLNTAARLEAACRPGQVLVGEDTWRLTRASIAYEVLGEIQVKGKADPIATFQVVAESEQVDDDVAPFVGRQSELASLQRVLADSAESGTARLATVIGAPGVGKTRLAAQLCSSHDVHSFDLRFERRGSTTFTPIADLLRELTGTGSAGDVARLVTDHPEADHLADVLSSILGYGEARSTEESFWAVRRLLEMLASEGPSIVVVDDIQWAEPLFWDLLDHLVEWTEAPLFILALARPELRELRPELAHAGKRVAVAVALEGLDAATTRELAVRLLGTEELPGELIKRLPESTEGNPLFVRELMQMLVDDGVLERSGDRWQLTIDVDAIEVPPTILSLLASRVDRLPDDEREVVELASVIGTEFDRGALTAIAGKDTRLRVGTLIDRLRRKDLIEPSGVWAGDQPVYRFHHVLIRDAAYRRLLKAHRADLHERVGRHFETAETTAELDVVIAYHYEQAHVYRSDLGTLDVDTLALAEQAARRLQIAAVLALAREDLSSSGTYALRALALTAESERRDELLTLGSEALLASGDVARGAPIVEELSARSTDSGLIAWADCFQAQLWSLTDAERLIEASELADDAAGRLAVLGDDAGVAKARLVRASILARLGRVGECESELDLALGAARAAGDRRRTVAVLGAAPLAALWGPSPVSRAGGRCLDVLRLLRITTTSPAVEATSIRCQGMLEALRGNFDSARDKFEASRSTARNLGLRHGLYETELFAGFVELLAGDPVAAEPHLVLARNGLGALGIGADAGKAASWLARSMLLQDRVDEADVLAAGALESAGQNLQTVIGSRAVLAEVRARQDRHGEARRLASEAIEIAEQTDITLDHALAVRSAARVAELCGDMSAASRHWEVAAELLKSKGVTGLTDGASPPAAGSRDEHQGDEAATNRAWDAFLRFEAALHAADGRVARSCLSAGYDYGWHDPLRPTDHAASVDKHLAALIASIDDTAKPVLVAWRGTNLALGRGEVGDGSASAATHFVVRVGDGLIDRTDWFGSDQADDAYEELERQWVESGGQVDSVMNAIAQTMSTGPFEEYAELYAPQFEVIDHREMGMGRRSRAEYLESTRSIVGNVTVHGCTEYLALEDGISLIRAGMTSNRDGASWELYLINQHDGERTIRWEQFPISGRDDAIVRFRHLIEQSNQTSLTVPGNRAWRIALQFREAFDDGDLTRQRELLHPRFASHLRMSLLGVTETLDADGHLDQTAVIAETGGLVQIELLAMRSDDLVLSRVVTGTDDAISERLLVLQTADDLVIDLIWFDDTQLDEALAELDGRWIDIGGPAEIIEPISEFRRIFARGTKQDLDDMVADDFVSIDHRPLGLGVRRAHDWVQSTGEFVGRATVTVARYLEIEGPLHLSEGSFSLHDSGEVLTDGLVITNHSIEEGLRRMELFDKDQLDTARRRFAEIAQSSTGHTISSSPNDQALRIIKQARDVDQEGAAARYDELSMTTIPRSIDSNTAVRIVHEVLAACERLDRPALEALVHDDFVSSRRERRYQALGITDLDKPGYIDDVIDTATWAEGSSNPVTDRRPIALAGDDLYLSQGQLHFGNDIVDSLTVTECRDGRLAGLTWFDVDDIGDAFAELDRRWIELGGPKRLLRWGQRLRAVLASGTPAGLADLTADELVVIDHRPLGFEERDRDEWLESMVPLVGDWDSYATVLEHAESVWLAAGRMQRRSDGALSVDGLLLQQIDTDDRLVRMELFDRDRLVDARHRFHELANESSTSDDQLAVVANAASFTMERFANAVTEGDLDWFVQMMHAEYEHHLHRGLRVEELITGEDAIELIRTMIAGGGTLSCETIAVRGDHLVLGRLTMQVAADEVVLLYVLELRDGLIRFAATFDSDQLDDALTELDRRWSELGERVNSGGPIGPVHPALHYVETFADAWNADDLDRARSLLDPGLAAFSHRAVVARGTVRGADAHDAVLSFHEYLPRCYFNAVATRSDDLALVKWTLQGPDGNDEQVIHLVIQIGPNNVVVRAATFDADDIDGARAVLERWALEVEGGLRNNATRLGDELAAAYESGDVERLRRVVSIDFVWRLRTSFASALDAPDRDRDSYIEGVLSRSRSRTNRSTIEREVLAVRGDELFLARSLMRDGDDEIDRLGIGQSANGQLVQLIQYDVHQLDEALDELDRIHVESGGPARLLDVQRRYRRALGAGDVDEARGVLSANLVIRDHRPLALIDNIDRDGYLDSTVRHARGTRMVILDIAAHTEKVALEHVRFVARDQSTWGDQWSVVCLDAEGLASIDIYPVDDFDAAHARYRKAVMYPS